MNKTVGFWFRLLIRGLDAVLLFSIVIGVAFSMLENSTEKWKFKSIWMFYFWFSIFMLSTFIYFIVIPKFTNGQTFFMILFKIKILFKKNNFISLLKRELFFSLNWILMMFLVMSIINHTLFDRYALVDNSKIEFSDIEKARINFVISINSILFFFQFIFAISIIVRKNKIGLHDSYSETKTIWTNKFLEKTKETKEVKKIQPKEVKNIPYYWVDFKRS